MFRIIIVTTSVLTFSFGFTAEFHGQTSAPIESQTYHIDEVPASYDYDNAHDLERPTDDDVKQTQSTKIKQRPVQYAPLPLQVMLKSDKMLSTDLITEQTSTKVLSSAPRTVTTKNSSYISRFRTVNRVNISHHHHFLEPKYIPSMDMEEIAHAHLLGYVPDHKNKLTKNSNDKEKQNVPQEQYSKNNHLHLQDMQLINPQEIFNKRNYLYLQNTKPTYLQEKHNKKDSQNMKPAKPSAGYYTDKLAYELNKLLKPEGRRSWTNLHEHQHAYRHKDVIPRQTKEWIHSAILAMFTKVPKKHINVNRSYKTPYNLISNDNGVVKALPVETSVLLQFPKTRQYKSNLRNSENRLLPMFIVNSNSVSKYT